jgi:hypothetical protein
MTTLKKAIVLQDLPTAGFPLAIIPEELFTFSPFGLGCRQCTKCASIQLDERSLQIHLKKHCMDSRVVTVRSIFERFKLRIDNAKESGTIEPFQSDTEIYIGCSCICGRSFLKKANALRHCKKLGCDASKLQKVELIKLCCGRYVSQSQVTALFNNKRQSMGKHGSLNSAVAVHLEDLPPAVFPLASIPELFIFSPFGLCCRQCNKGARIKLDERSIGDHLKKHRLDSRISVVRSILDDFTTQVSSARASGSIEP